MYILTLLCVILMLIPCAAPNPSSEAGSSNSTGGGAGDGNASSISAGTSELSRYELLRLIRRVFRYDCPCTGSGIGCLLGPHVVCENMMEALSKNKLEEQNLLSMSVCIMAVVKHTLL